MERPGPAERPVLILDFGSQYGQLIARRVREQNVFCQIVRHDLPAERVARAEPARPHPLRRPGQRLRAGRPALRPAALRPRRPGPRHLLRHAARLPGARRRGRARRPAASSAGPRAASSTPTSRCSTACPETTTVWMSHGDQVARRRRRLRPAGRDGHLPGRRRPPSHPADLRARSSTPRSATRRTARRSSATSSTTSAAARARGRWTRSSTRRSTRSAQRVGPTTGSSAACPAASIRR